MAPVRVRGCAGGRAPGNTVEHLRQADARRRPNGPRKATFRRPITVRLRGKACPAEGPDVPHGREKGSSREQGRQPPQQADVGTKTRSAGRVASPHAGVVDRDGPRRVCPWVLFRPLSWTGGGGAASTAPKDLFPVQNSPPIPTMCCVMTTPSMGIRISNRAVRPERTGTSTEGGQRATSFRFP